MDIAFKSFDKRWYEKEYKLPMHKRFGSKERTYADYLKNADRCDPNEWFSSELYAKMFDVERAKAYTNLCSRVSLNSSTTTSNTSIRGGNERGIVISLTSHPKRINTTYLAIESMYRQILLPHKIVLNLALEDFPNKKIPESLRFFEKEKGLEINFTDNFRVATKILPTLKKYPDMTIVTIDDDRIYSPYLLEYLCEQSAKYPGVIVSPRVRDFVFSKKRGIDYLYREHPGCKCSKDSSSSSSSLSSKKTKKGKGKSEASSSSSSNSSSSKKKERKCKCKKPYGCCHCCHKHKLKKEPGYYIFEGFAAVLYPPGAFHNEVFNFENFNKLTPFADDVWLQTMAILSGTKSIGLKEKRAIVVYNAPEIPSTQECGLYKRHLYANDLMSYRALKYYGLLETLGFKPIKHLKCIQCAREVPMILTSLHSITMENTSIDCPCCLNTNKKKILFVGASGYGNIGDNMYAEIWSKVFSEHVMKVVPDTVYVDEDGMYCISSPQDYFKPDLLVIGGGGILKNFEKNACMMYHFDYAVKHNIPYVFASVGLQISDLKIVDSAYDLQKYLGPKTIDILRGAQLILVRSYKDELLLRSLDIKKVFYYTDACYMYPLIANIISKRESKRYISLIPAGTCNIRIKEVKAKIDESLRKFPYSTLIVMNWGGMSNPLKTGEEYADIHIFDEIREMYPKATILMGDGLSKQLQDFRYGNKEIRKSDLTPAVAADIINKSHIVITGRYHGYVLAKALNVPVYAPIQTYKMIAEKAAPLTFSSESRFGSTSIQILEYFIKNMDCSLSLLNILAEDIGDDERNYRIDELSKRSGLSVALVQSLSNDAIYKCLATGDISNF